MVIIISPLELINKVDKMFVCDIEIIGNIYLPKKLKEFFFQSFNMPFTYFSGRRNKSTDPSTILQLTQCDLDTN